MFSSLISGLLSYKHVIYILLKYNILVQWSKMHRNVRWKDMYTFIKFKNLKCLKRNIIEFLTSLIITVMINKTKSWLAIWVVNIFCRIGDLVYLVKLKYLQVHLKDQPNSLRVRFSYLTHLFVFLFLLRYDLNLRWHTAAPRPNQLWIQYMLGIFNTSTKSCIQYTLQKISTTVHLYL
jgi:hypothetical protein